LKKTVGCLKENGAMRRVRSRGPWDTSRRRLQASIRALALSLGLVSFACGGQASFEKSLDQMWQWDGGEETRRVLGRLQGKTGILTVPAAVGVTPHGL